MIRTKIIFARTLYLPTASFIKGACFGISDDAFEASWSADAFQTLLQKQIAEAISLKLFSQIQMVNEVVRDPKRNKPSNLISLDSHENYFTLGMFREVI